MVYNPTLLCQLFQCHAFLGTMMFLVFHFSAKSQVRLAPMPEPTSNNAVVGYTDRMGDFHVYSFGGIGAGLTFNDIHRQCYHYNASADQWTTIAELPDGPGRIAAGASVVKNKIYIIGGYEVFSDGSENSLSYCHIYDPEKETFESNGSALPIPIDDHVQAVWRDSLIYVVTGWSQRTNVPQVQIYYPDQDFWLMGTPVGNSRDYRAFGASGCIIGDTIFYIGGAKIGTTFPITSILRKGVINPNDPTQISWSVENMTEAIGYRMAASSSADHPVWFGGSHLTYNYDGVAYNGTGIVSPVDEIKLYQNSTDSWYLYKELIPPTMDFRGIGKKGEREFIIAGGMHQNLEVTAETWLITIPVLSDNSIDHDEKIEFFPNPTWHFIDINLEGEWVIEVFNSSGSYLSTMRHQGTSRLNTEGWEKGCYYLKIKGEGVFSKKIIKH